jgi:ABC-2 type transport system permease protein
VNGLRLALRQVRYENRAFWRNPAAAFFTFAFPLMFLVIFNLVFGSGTTRRFGPPVRTSTFYIPAVAAFSVITACYTNIAISVAFSRDQGVLKRIRGTPLPPWAYLFGRIVHAVLIAILLVVIVVAFGRLAYDIEVPTARLPAFALSIAVGAACFSALGLAATALIPNADAAPAVVNATVLPLLFISDVFIPLDQAPTWLGRVADVFPIRHFSEALIAVYNPFARGSGLEGADLAVMGVWAIVGAALAFRFFSWEPRS